MSPDTSKQKKLRLDRDAKPFPGAKALILERRSGAPLGWVYREPAVGDEIELGTRDVLFVLSVSAGVVVNRGTTWRGTVAFVDPVPPHEWS